MGDEESLQEIHSKTKEQILGHFDRSLDLLHHFPGLSSHAPRYRKLLIGFVEDAYIELQQYHESEKKKVERMVCSCEGHVP